MSLTEQINQDIKKAMLAKEKDKLAALRAVKSALLLEATKGTGDVSEDVEIKIIQKLHKQRVDAAKIYIEQDRQDLADDEIYQADVINVYLPALMSEEEVRSKVVAQIQKVGASSPADIGKVMGPLMGALSGKADGALISKLVKEELSK